MKNLFAAVLVLCSTACAYHAPDAPTPVQAIISDSAPYSMSIGSKPDLARGVTVMVKVQNLHGAPLFGVPVHFTTDVGVFTPVDVSTDSEGTASSGLTISSTAAVTATAGTLTVHTLIQPR